MTLFLAAKEYEYKGRDLGTRITAHRPRSRRLHAFLYEHYVAPYLGLVLLRDLSSNGIARWQTDTVAAGAGPNAVRKSLRAAGTGTES